MAAKKPASNAARMRALALSLGNLSDLLGGSTVTLGGKFSPNTLIAYMGDPGPADALKKGGIHVTVPYWGTRVYTLVGSDLLLTQDVGGRGKSNIVTSHADFEEPIAFLLERTSNSDNFKDVTENFSYEQI